VFTIASGVLYFCSLFYLIFASGELQSWSINDRAQQKIRINSEKFPVLLSPVERHSKQSIINGDS